MSNRLEYNQFFADRRSDGSYTFFQERVVSENSTGTNPGSIMPVLDLSNEQQVREYFYRLEQECPGVIKAMKELNVSYQQYLVSLLALNRPVSFSTNSAKLYF